MFRLRASDIFLTLATGFVILLAATSAGCASGPERRCRDAARALAVAAPVPPAVGVVCGELSGKAQADCELAAELAAEVRTMAEAMRAGVCAE